MGATMGHLVIELIESSLNTLITWFHYFLYGLYTYINSSGYWVMLFCQNLIQQQGAQKPESTCSAKK